MPLPGAAQAILASIPGLQSAERDRGNALAGYGEAIHQTGKAVGGLLKAQQRRKEETDISEIEDAKRSILASGKPEAATAVFGALRPKTVAGKAYLSKVMMESFGIQADMITLEKGRLDLERKKTEPVRAAIIAKAHRGDPTAIDDAAALGDADFAHVVGGALRLAEGAGRAEAAAAEKKQEEARERGLEKLAQAASSQLGALLQANPELRKTPWVLKQFMDRSMVFGHPDVQERAMAKLGVFFSMDKAGDAEEASLRKERNAATTRRIRDEGLIPTLDDEGNIVAGPPNPKDVRAQEAHALRLKSADERSRRVGRIEALEDEARNAKDAGTRVAYLQKALNATNSYTKTYLMDEDGMPLSDKKEEIAEMEKRALGYVNELANLGVTEAGEAPQMTPETDPELIRLKAAGDKEGAKKYARSKGYIK